MMMMISSVVLSMLNPPWASLSERPPVKGHQNSFGPIVYPSPVTSMTTAEVWITVLPNATNGHGPKPALVVAGC
jgi:hypothetical protein